MGIILKQSLKGTVISYLGAAVGAITIVFVFPKALTSEEIGMINYIWAIVLIFSQIFSLGFLNVINRLFPYFKNNKTHHNGFLTLGFGVSFLGVLMALITFISLIPLIKSTSDISSDYLNHYVIIYSFPVIAFAILLNYLDVYFKALYNATIGILLKDGLNKILNLTFSTLYLFNFISFNLFIFFYFFSYCLSFFILFILLFIEGEFSLQKPNIQLIKQHKKEILRISFFGIISGFTASIATNIDKIMIKEMINYSSTGIYSIAAFFGMIIMMPSRALNKISNTVISESWKNIDLRNIKVIYNKSSITLSTITWFIFLGIYINLNEVSEILGKDYQTKEFAFVIIILSLSNVVLTSSGVARDIIDTSKYYKYSAYFTFILFVSIVIGNYIFIHTWGIIGASIATLLSTSILVILRLLFVKKKFKIQPYSIQHLYILAIGIISIIPSFIIPSIGNPYFNILIKSSIFSILYGILCYMFSISEDINNIVNYFKNQIFKKFIK